MATTKNQDREREQAGEAILAAMPAEQAAQIQRAADASHYTRGYLAWLVDDYARSNETRVARGGYDIPYAHWAKTALYALSEAIAHPIPAIYHSAAEMVDKTMTRAVLGLVSGAADHDVPPRDQIEDYD